MGFLDTIFGTRRVTPPRPDPTRIIPPESPAIEMMRMQREIDPTKARWDRLDFLTGKLALHDYYYAEKGRHARRALIDKVDAGQGVTVRDLLGTVGADLDFSSADGAQVLSAHLDARRDQDRRANDGGFRGGPRGGGEGRTSPSAALEDAARARAEAVHDASPRPLEDWLGVSHAAVLNTMAEDPALRNPAADAGLEYEAIAIAWARTVLGEGLVRTEALPAAVRQWVTIDAEFRDTGEDGGGIMPRAIEVDRISFAHPRAKRHMLEPVRMTALAVEFANQQRHDRRGPGDALDERLRAEPRWSVWRSQRPTPRTRFGITEPEAGETLAPVPDARSEAPLPPRDALDPDLDFDVDDADLPPAAEAFAARWMDPLEAAPTASDAGMDGVDGDALAPVRARVVDADAPRAADDGDTMASGAPPRVWIDERPVAGTLIEIGKAGLVVRGLDGSTGTHRGLLSREGGPAIEAVDPRNDRYYLHGTPQPLELPTTLFADRAFRARLYAGWRRFEFTPHAGPLAVALVATMPPAEREALLARLGASPHPDDQAWAASAQLGHGTGDFGHGDLGVLP